MWPKIYFRWLLYSNSAALFDQLHRASWYSTIFSEWIVNLALQGQVRAIDVGCGPGALTLALHSHNVSAIGVDRAQNMLAYARRHGQQLGHENIFRIADAYAFPFGDRTFDVAMAASFINVVPDPVATLKEMVRVTKTGGQVSFLVPDVTMNRARAKQFAKTRQLSAADTVLLNLWSGRARKISQENAVELATVVNLRELCISTYLDAMIYTVTGKV